MLSQFACFTTGELNVTVQDVQDAYAYAINEFLFRVRDYGLTQFRLGRVEYMKGVIIRFLLASSYIRE